MTTGKIPEATRQEIIRLAEEGLSGNQIAARLGVSRSKTQDILHAWEASQRAGNGRGPDRPPPQALKDVPLAQIHLEGDTKARNAINGHLVNEYAEAMSEGAAFPPVVLFRAAAGYWIGDGHHRCRAAQ